MSLDLRAGCHGETPLTARLNDWQKRTCSAPDELSAWLERYGSPLNLLDPHPMRENARQLSAVAAAARLDFRIFFARKANKALAFVDEAIKLGIGVDVASMNELRQALDRGVPASDLVVTAAVKPRALLELCVESGATIVIDNEDELAQLLTLSAGPVQSVSVALRLAPIIDDATRHTRFGAGLEEMLSIVERHIPVEPAGFVSICGVHFHLDGYDSRDRITAIAQSITLIEGLRERGHGPAFIDIGGGIPISYIQDEAEWERFWHEHHRAVLGLRPPLTYDGHTLGLTAHAGAITGGANVYPTYQRPTRGDWLGQILTADVNGESVSEALNSRGLQLRCEPGRALTDGCGLTVARVEFRKQRADGSWLIGVAMNRTQCRSAADDFLLDPLLLRPHTPDEDPRPTGPISGYLVGAYCIERELLTWRQMAFPHGVQVGDLVVFPNTAGYMMHILESASHQIPLARNLVVNPAGPPELDRIDAAGGARPRSDRS
jgi:diaminopimelate decarboxylase